MLLSLSLALSSTENFDSDFGIFSLSINYKIPRWKDFISSIFRVIRDGYGREKNASGELNADENKRS